MKKFLNRLRAYFGKRNKAGIAVMPRLRRRDYGRLALTVEQLNNRITSRLFRNIQYQISNIRRHLSRPAHIFLVFCLIISIVAINFFGQTPESA